MFTHMTFVARQQHRARESGYELLVYRVQESDEYRIYVAKDGFGVGDIFTASQSMVGPNAKGCEETVQKLIDIAKSAIDRNEFGLY